MCMIGNRVVYRNNFEVVIFFSKTKIQHSTKKQKQRTKRNKNNPRKKTKQNKTATLNLIKFRYVSVNSFPLFLYEIGLLLMLIDFWVDFLHF